MAYDFFIFPTKEHKVRRSRLKKTSAVYAKLSDPGIKNETNDCGVRALAIVAQAPYGEAHLALQEIGRKPRKGTYTWQAQEAFELLTLRKMVDVPLEKIGRCYYPTLAQFVRTHPTGTYYMCTHNHAFALVDGIVHDWSNGAGSRSRILNALRCDVESA